MKGKFRWYHIALLVTGFLVLAAVTVFLIMNYKNINTEIPTHYNASGEADGFGAKSSLILQMGMAWGLFIVLNVVGRIPSVWNLGPEVREENREKAEAISRTMLCILTFLIPAFFSYAVLCSVRGAALSPAALPLFLVAVFGTIVISVARLFRNR